MTTSISGIGVSAGLGIAIGKAAILSYNQINLEASWVPPSEIDSEIERFHAAIETATEQVHSIKRQIPDETAADIVEFIDAHLLMLQDKAITDAPIELIQQESCSAEWALHLHRNTMVQVFDEMEDPYLKTRKDDVNYVVERILSVLQNRPQPHSDNLADHIVVAQDLTPADIVLIRHRGAVGLITEHGSSISHSAILARSMGMPAIVGAAGSTSLLQPDELLVLDAVNGILLSDCNQQDIDYFEQRRDKELKHRKHLQTLRDLPARTTDGLDITILANIELANDVEVARANSAQGIGLYRTEFLYMNRSTPPDEEEHFQTYRRVVEAMNGLPVTIRTLDLGADKTADSVAQSSVHASNPALGLRAIRLCLNEPELFTLQLRGMLRASAYGQLRIMIPMLTNMDEAREARFLIAHELQILRERGLRIPEPVVGAMIETPAAALTAASFAAYFDFLSIGTNDLVQYILAVDRANDHVSHLYQPTHPAVIRLIAEIISAADNIGTPISVCGELASNPDHLSMLVGMGLTRFSVQPEAVLEIKQRLHTLDAKMLKLRVQELLATQDLVEFEQQLAALTRL